MTPFARKIIKEVADEWGVNPALLMGKCRRKRVVCARMDAVKRMHAHGYSPTKIGKVLGYDHTTILFYLSRKKAHKPPTPEWHAPQVRHLYWVKRPQIPRPPPKEVRYLVPYAGADWTEYRWKECPKLEAAHEHGSIRRDDHEFDRSGGDRAGNRDDDPASRCAA